MTARYQIIVSGGVFDFQNRAIVLPADDAWREYQDYLTGGGVVLPPDATGQMDLAAAKAARKAEINAYAASLRNRVIAGISPGEMASWSIKITEARMYQAAPVDASAPTLAAIAVVRGVTTAEMVSRVLASAAPVMQAEVAIDGMRGRHCDVIDAAADVQTIILYDWHAGWPAIP